MKSCRFIFLSLILLAVCLLASCEKECKHPNIQNTEMAATCTEAGKISYLCPDCSYTYIDLIVEPKGHSYNITVTDPVCNEGGSTEYICECGYSYVSDHISALGHDITKKETAPTCTEMGYTSYICSRCDFKYNGDFIDPNDHVIVSTVIEPTCTDNGYTDYSCKNCDLEYRLMSAEPLGHTYSEATVSNVSCTEKGEIKYACKCGDEYSVILSPLGHDFSKAVTMPSISDMGSTEFSCGRCDFTYVGDFRFYSQILKDAYANNAEVMADGIDISMYNYKVDANGDFISLNWDAIKNAGIEYAIIKAGSSFRENGTLGGIEPTFEKSYTDAKAAGIDVGVYFYTYATSVDEIALDAYLLLSILDGKQFEYPIYLDLEDSSLSHLDPATLTEMCVEFFTILQRAGYYTGLYVNNEWLYNKVITEVALSKFELWYARYPSSEEKVWNAELYGEHLGMWQYSDAGSIEGIEDVPFDMNFSFKDYPALIKEGGFNGYCEDIKFIDSDKEFVYVIWNTSIKVRSSSDYFTADEYDSNADVIGYAKYGSRFQVLEKTEQYTKILYNGKIAYVSANPLYVSFDGLF